MAAYVFVTLALIAATSCSAFQGAAVSSSATTIDRYPSVVQVEFLGVFSGLWSQSCAATILTSYHVLSAANCFTGMLYQSQHRRIRAGATYRNTGGIVSYIVRENNHPAFAVIGLDGDVTVVRLVTQLTYSPVVQQAPIIYQGAYIPDSLPLVHAGWGNTRNSDYPSDVLLDVTMYKFSNEYCASRYATVPGAVPVTNNMICSVLLTSGDDDLCQGDFGGPLYYSGTVCGIVSWGFGCTNASYPIVSTNVAVYTDWIVAAAV